MCVEQMNVETFWSEICQVNECAYIRVCVYCSCVSQKGKMQSSARGLHCCRISGKVKRGREKISPSIYSTGKCPLVTVSEIRRK